VGQKRRDKNEEIRKGEETKALNKKEAAIGREK